MFKKTAVIFSTALVCANAFATEDVASDDIKAQIEDLKQQVATLKQDMEANQSTHEEIKQNCKQCEYMATTEVGLVNHNKKVHEGITHDCQ